MASKKSSGISPSEAVLSAISQDGYCWRSGWELAHESSLSLLWKLILVNGMSASEIEPLLGIRMLQTDAQTLHSRSFLNTTWAISQNKGSPYFKALVDRASFNGLSAVSTVSIASDQSIRYCPRCIDGRYHSFYFQLDALQCCPIHDEPLICECRHCGHRLGRFAWNSATMGSPFSCPYCDQWLGYGKSSETPRDFDLKLDCTALDPLANFIKSLQCAKIDWLGHEFWWPYADPLSGNTKDKRAAIFSIYHYMVGGDLEGISVTPITLHFFDAAFNTSSETPPIRRDRRLIFLRLQRYFRRCLSMNKGNELMEKTKEGLSLGSDYVYPNRPVCPYWFAYYLWQNQFMQLYIHPLQLRPAIAAWPSDFEVSDKTWRMFCVISYLSYVEIAKAWERLVVEDGEGGYTHESILGALDRLRQEMMPEWNAWPSSVGIVSGKTLEGREKTFVVAGGNLIKTVQELRERCTHADCSN